MTAGGEVATRVIERRGAGGGALPASPVRSHPAYVALRDGERVLAAWPCVGLDRRVPPGATPALPGALTVTTQRLVHRGPCDIEVELLGIREVSLVGGRFCLLLDEGRTIALEGPDLRAIRRAIRTARIEARERREIDQAPVR